MRKRSTRRRERSQSSVRVEIGPKPADVVEGAAADEEGRGEHARPLEEAAPQIAVGGRHHGLRSATGVAQEVAAVGAGHVVRLVGQGCHLPFELRRVPLVVVVEEGHEG